MYFFQYRHDEASGAPRLDGAARAPTSGRYASWSRPNGDGAGTELSLRGIAGHDDSIVGRGANPDGPDGDPMTDHDDCLRPSLLRYPRDWEWPMRI